MRILLLSILLIPWLLQARGEFKICGVEWPPFSYADIESNTLNRGISVEIYHQAFKRMNIQISVDQIPWARCERDVKLGVYDAILDNADLPEYIHASIPTAFYPLGAYVRQDSPLKQFYWSETANKRVGMVRGYDYTPKIRDHLDWEITLSKSDEQLLLLLNRKRVDYIILDYFSAPILAKKTNTHIRPLKPFIDTTPLYLCFNPKHTAIVKHLNQVLLDMLLDGSIDQIYQNHLKDSYGHIRNKAKLGQ